MLTYFRRSAPIVLPLLHVSGKNNTTSVKTSLDASQNCVHVRIAVCTHGKKIVLSGLGLHAGQTNNNKKTEQKSLKQRQVLK